MSAIAGVYRTDGAQVDRSEVERMLIALAHRGPDGTAVWSAPAVTLGQASLCATPEARSERLPLAGDGDQVAITADLRLDNRTELAAALDAAGAGDGELVLRAYQRWGEACVERLVGDFAFAIWDGRRRSLFCARDHVGVKPFYYAEASGAFVFASEIKALLTSPRVPYRLNAVRVADHLVGFFDDPAITFYRDVFRLPAAHALTLGPDGRRLRRYWSPDALRELSLGSDAAYAEAFRECFTAAVAARLRSSGRVGSLLSGGLDTSSIVATARRIRGGASDAPLDTFTAIFPGLPAADLRRIDERAFVEAVLAPGGADPHYVRGDLLSPLADIDEVLWQLDEAFAAPNLYLHRALYAAARQRGVRVLLDGIDGDSTVSHGVEWLPVLARNGRMLRLAREVRALSRTHEVPARRLLRQLLLPALVPASADRVAALFRPHRQPAWMVGTAIRHDFARRMGVVERVEAWQAPYRRPARSAREAHARALASGLIPYALEVADRAAAGFELEPRYPFFDRRLMELCLALPPEQKLAGGWPRSVMRRAMAGILPEQVRWRPSKANLGPNFTRQLLARDRDLLDEVIVQHPAVVEDYVDVPALRRAYDRYVAGHAAEHDVVAVYRAVVLGLWLRRAKIAP